MNEFKEFIKLMHHTASLLLNVATELQKLEDLNNARHPPVKKKITPKPKAIKKL